MSRFAKAALPVKDKYVNKGFSGGDDNDTFLEDFSTK
jgi:hypothetical protein